MLVILILYAVFGHQCLADNGSEIEFEHLLTARRNLTCNISRRFPPLHEATFRGSIKLATKTLLELKESGNKCRCLNYQDSEGMTALHWASLLGHEAIVRSLLESGANTTYVDKCNNTALHLATQSCNIKTIRWLIMFGVNLNAKNKNGSTALHLAVENGQFSTVGYLICSCAALNVTDHKGMTPLDLALAKKNWPIATLLKASGAKSTQKSELYHWVNKTAEDFSLPRSALKGGKTYGGQTLYIGRIWNKNDYVPATIIPYHKKIIAIIDGKYSEVSRNFQVVCSEHLAWKPIKANETIPETAFVAGTSIKGEKTYIGRAYVLYSEKYMMTPGKICETERVLKMPFYSNDSMVPAKDYEILVESF